MEHQDLELQEAQCSYQSSKMGTSFQDYNKETMALAQGKDLPVSFKHCVNICKFLKGKDLDKAMEYLEKVVEKEKAIPWKKYRMKQGHKKGMGPGKYPIKASKHIIKVLKNLKNNAVDKGLSENLRIIHAAANRAVSKEARSRYMRGRSTNVEFVAEEQG